MAKFYREIAPRLQFVNEFYGRGWKKWVISIVWGLPWLLGIYDFLLGEEYLPKAWPTLTHIIPNWLLFLWWPIGWLIVLVFVTFEGAYRKMRPCLVIKGVGEPENMPNNGTGWGLKIHNSGTTKAKNCCARILEIVYEDSGRSLRGIPIDRPFHWAGQEQTEYDLEGSHTARLNIVYHEYVYGENMESIQVPLNERVTLAFRMEGTQRVYHDLLNYNTNGQKVVLLSLRITSDGKLPQYVVCRIDIEAIARDLLFGQENQRPAFELLKQSKNELNLKEFIVH